MSSPLLERLVGRGRGLARRSLRVLLLPVRRLVGALVDRRPALGPRLSRWTWLWQPGWGRRGHERLYAGGADPYGFDRPHEQTKYQQTLDLLGGRRFARAVEIGASEGAFTELLHRHCDEVVATELSEIAVERARERLAGLPGVVVERRALPFDLPSGDFDLVMCSDVLYLWEADVLERGLRLLAARTRPGGLLVLVHYGGQFGALLTARQVHETARRLAPELELDVVPGVAMSYPGPHGEGDAGYEADVLVRRPPGARMSRSGWKPSA